MLFSRFAPFCPILPRFARMGCAQSPLVEAGAGGCETNDEASFAGGSESDDDADDEMIITPPGEDSAHNWGDIVSIPLHLCAGVYVYHGECKRHGGVQCLYSGQLCRFPRCSCTKLVEKTVYMPADAAGVRTLQPFVINPHDVGGPVQCRQGRCHIRPDMLRFPTSN